MLKVSVAGFFILLAVAFYRLPAFVLYLINASVAFTMDTYSHIISGMQEDMMALLDDVLPAGKSGVGNQVNTYP